MLQRERARATERLRRKAMQMNKKLSEMFTLPLPLSQSDRERREADSLRWNMLCAKYMQAGLHRKSAEGEPMQSLVCPPITAPGRRA